METVFILDDDISLRESLEMLITVAGWHAETFARADEFFARPPADDAACLILDIELPDLNGLDVQKRVSSMQETMPVIFITGHGDIPMSVRAMKAGAVEFLTKPFPADALLDAVRDAIERSRAARKREAERRGLRERYSLLTPREREVMSLVVSGLLNKQIGYELGASEITIKAHRGRVMRKMQAASLADLVRMADSLELPIVQPTMNVLNA